MTLIKRADVENEKIECEEGVIVLVAPEGTPSVRYIRLLASKVLGGGLLPQRVKRFPNDGLSNAYRLGDLPILKTKS